MERAARRRGPENLFINVTRDDESALSKTVCLYTLLLHFSLDVLVYPRTIGPEGIQRREGGVIELTINPAHFRANGYL